jgi:hypothetical protein
MPYDKQQELAGQYRRHLQDLGQDLREKYEHREIYHNYVITHTDPGDKNYPTVKFENDKTYYICYPQNADDYSDLMLHYNGNVVDELRTKALSITVLPDNLTVKGDLVVGVEVLALPNDLTVGRNMYIGRNYNKVDFQNLTVSGSFLAECIANFEVEIDTDKKGFVRLKCGEPDLCKC